MSPLKYRSRRWPSLSLSCPVCPAEIVQSTGGHELIQPGETCPLDSAYCRLTVELDSPLAVQCRRIGLRSRTPASRALAD
ncbi:hypothetical protein C8039_02575 [Halogeometricum sp. wsp3]|nr:hypothetical protein C8039_02575 [Halogeometricum sp. wsp3]